MGPMISTCYAVMHGALWAVCHIWGYALQGHANRYKRHIVPVLSLSVDFYVRVFVRIYTSPAAVKDCGSKLMYVYQSQGCDSFYAQRVGRKVGPIHCILLFLHCAFASLSVTNTSQQSAITVTNIALCGCSRKACLLQFWLYCIQHILSLMLLFAA